MTRSSTEVRSSRRRTSSLCRSSTSAMRYSATVRSLPENSAANRPGSGCPASDSAASRSPAAQPSVRSCNIPSAGSDSSTPAAANSSRASATLNRRSSARISVSSPSSRSRCSPSRRSCRVASTNRSSGGPRITSSSSWRSASSGPSSCASSITSQIGSSSGARSFSSRSTIAQPSRPGAAVSSRTSVNPAAVPRSASATEIQNRCGSRSWPCTGTHAAREARPVSPIHERSKNVFPLPAGADIRVTRAAPASRAERARRETIPPWTAGTTTAAAGDRAAGLIAVRARGRGLLRVLSATNAPDQKNHVAAGSPSCLPVQRVIVGLPSQSAIAGPGG